MDSTNRLGLKNTSKSKLDKIEEYEDEQSFASKETRPVKNSVMFESDVVGGYDNKCFQKDQNDKIEKFNKVKPDKNKNIIRVGYSERLKKVLFAIICINYLFYGFANNLIGATIPIMRENLQVSNKEILSSFTIRYTSYFLSNLLTIYTFEHLRQYQFSLGILIHATVFFILPSIKNYAYFLCLFGLLGAGNVLLDSIPILLTVEMFQEKSKFYSQVMFVFFAFGGFLGPLVAGQFVRNEPIEEEIAMNFMNNGTSIHKSYADFNPAAQYYVVYNIFNVFFQNNKTHRINHEISSIENKQEIFKNIEHPGITIPFYLIATLFSIVLIVQMVIQYFYPYKKPKTIDRSKRASMRVEPYFPVEELPLTTEEDCEIVKKEEAKLPNYYKKSVIALFCIVLLCFNSIDQTFSLFLSTYLNRRTDLQISKNLQSSYYSYLAITNTMGKLCSLVLIWYIPQKVYLIMNWTFILIGIILLNFVTIEKLYILKISLLLIGAGISSTYPLVFTLANKRVSITSKTQTIFLIAIVSQMLYLPIVFGFFIETHTNIFNLFLNTFSTIACVTMVMFHLIDLKRTSFLKSTSNPKPEA